MENRSRDPHLPSVWLEALESAKAHIESGYGWCDLSSFLLTLEYDTPDGVEVPAEVAEFYLYQNAELVEIPDYGIAYNFNASREEIIREYVTTLAGEKTCHDLLTEIARLREDKKDFNLAAECGWNAALDALQDFIIKQ